MLDKAKEIRDARIRRHIRIRRKVRGTSDRPRLCVFRSSRHIYAQLIDDSNHRTIASTGRLQHTEKGKIAESRLVGQRIAKLALDKGIQQVIFDRGGFIFHGRIKALAEAAREAGLKF